MILKKVIKKFIHFFGVDVKKYNPNDNELNALKSYDIGTILDIGANIGQFAVEARKFFPEALIYSFEPIDDCYNDLLKQLENDDKFKAFNFALGEENKEEAININSYSPSSSILKLAELHKNNFSYAQEDSIQKIKVKKLDEIFDSLDKKGNILIKMDVQGYEDRVIGGGKLSILKAKVIIIETSFAPLYEGQMLFNDINGLLKELGYSYTGSLCQKKSPLNGIILSQDSLFVRA